MLLSIARAPLGLDPLQLPAVAAEDASLFRALALLAVTVGLGLAGRGLEGRGAGAWLLFGLPFGFGAHALLCGTVADSLPGLLLLSAGAALVLVLLGRLGCAATAAAEPPARARVGCSSGRRSRAWA